MVSKEIAQRAFRFSCRIVKLYERLIKKGDAARELAPQLPDSGASIGANLEESTAEKGGELHYAWGMTHTRHFAFCI